MAHRPRPPAGSHPWRTPTTRNGRGQVLAAVCAVLADCDPEYLTAAGAPADEYEVEAREVLTLPVVDGPGVAAVFARAFAPVGVVHPDEFWEGVAANCADAISSG